MWGGDSPPHWSGARRGVPRERTCFEFSSKKSRVLCIFLAKKTSCGQKTEPGEGLRDPLAAADVERAGLKI